MNREHKSTENKLKALRSIRAAHPDGERIFFIMSNLSDHTGQRIRHWAAKHQVELCFTPTYSFWADPIQAHFGPCANLEHPPTTPSRPACSRHTCGGVTLTLGAVTRRSGWL